MLIIDENNYLYKIFIYINIYIYILFIYFYVQHQTLTKNLVRISRAKRVVLVFGLFIISDNSERNCYFSYHRDIYFFRIYIIILIVIFFAETRN